MTEKYFDLTTLSEAQQEELFDKAIKDGKATFRYMCPEGFVKEEVITKGQAIRGKFGIGDTSNVDNAVKEGVACEAIAIVDETDRVATDWDKTFTPTLSKEEA